MLSGVGQNAKETRCGSERSFPPRRSAPIPSPSETSRQAIRDTRYDYLVTDDHASVAAHGRSAVTRTGPYDKDVPPEPLVPLGFLAAVSNCLPRMELRDVRCRRGPG
jgi:hypothetical protein